MVDWKDWSSGNYEHAIGYLVPSILLTVATLGAGGGVKGALGQVPSLPDLAGIALVMLAIAIHREARAEELPPARQPDARLTSAIRSRC